MLTHSFEQVTPHVWWLSANSETDRPTLGVVVGSKGTLIVDTGNSPAHARHLLDEMKHRGLAVPTYAVLTHWHWDHVFGSNEFHVPLLAHVDTTRVVKQMASWEWGDADIDERVRQGLEIPFCRDHLLKEMPDRSGLVLRAPDISFTDKVVLDLGDVTAEIIHVGGDHAADSSIVYVPQDKVVFLSDCMYHDIYHTPHRYTTAKLFPMMDTLFALDTDKYLEGHNPQPFPRAEFESWTNSLRAVGQAVVSPDQDRIETFAALKAQFGDKILDEDISYVDEFLEGLRNPTENLLP